MARTPLTKQHPYAILDAHFVNLGLTGKGGDDRGRTANGID